MAENLKIILTDFRAALSGKCKALLQKKQKYKKPNKKTQNNNKKINTKKLKKTVRK